MCVLVVVVGLVVVGRAAAAAPAFTRECDDVAVWDPDVCERVDYLTVAADAHEGLLVDIRWGVGIGVGVALAALTVPAVVRSFRMGHS